MNKKLLMVLAAGALVITGCAAKEANKEKSEKNNSEQKDVPKEEKKQEQKVVHDLAEVEKLINKVAVSGNDLSRLKEQTNLLAWITQDRVKK